MGYDIYFVRRDPGQPFEEALDDTEDAFDSDLRPLDEEEVEQWDRIVSRAREILGDIEVFADDVSRELTDPTTGVELTMTPLEVAITVPYGEATADSVALMTKVYALARAVEDETGLEGYDPQLGEAVSDARPEALRGRPLPKSPSDEWDESAATAPPTAPPPGETVTSRPERHERPGARRWWEFWKS